MPKPLSLPLELQEASKDLLGGNDYSLFREAREVIELGLPSDVRGEMVAYLIKNTKSQEGLSDLKYRLKTHFYDLNHELTNLRSDIRQELKDENSRYTREDLQEACARDTRYTEYERTMSLMTSLVDRIDELMWILKSIMGKVA